MLILFCMEKHRLVSYFCRFNLATERFSQTLAFPPESYKKQTIMYHLKKHGRMIEVILFKIIIIIMIQGKMAFKFIII